MFSAFFPYNFYGTMAELNDSKEVTAILNSAITLKQRIYQYSGRKANVTILHGIRQGHKESLPSLLFRFTLSLVIMNLSRFFDE
jgi:hypothetical protein